VLASPADENLVHIQDLRNCFAAVRSERPMPLRFALNLALIANRQRRSIVPGSLSYVSAPIQFRYFAQYLGLHARDKGVRLHQCQRLVQLHMLPQLEPAVQSIARSLHAPNIVARKQPARTRSKMLSVELSRRHRMHHYVRIGTTLFTASVVERPVRLCARR